MAKDLDIEVTPPVEDVTQELASAVEGGIAKSMLQAAEIARGALAVEAPVDRGTLRQSFKATLLSPRDGALRSGALSDLIYARQRDLGGDIVPRRASMLFVPVSRAAKSLSGRGVPVRSVTSRLKNTKSITHYVFTDRVRQKGDGYVDRATRRAEPDIAEVIKAGIGEATGGVE